MRLAVYLLPVLCVTVISGCDFSKPDPPVTRFAVIGDRTSGHLYDANDIDIHQRVLEAVETEPIDFAITVGDMIEGYTDHQGALALQWEDYFSLYQNFSHPTYFTPGNHDLFLEAQMDTYRAYVGEPYYAFSINNIHLIILDNSRWSPGLPLLDETQYLWLKQELSQNTDKLTLVFCHIPYWNNTIRDDHPTDSLHALFQKYQVDAVFAGHYHAFYQTRYDDITYVITGRAGGKTTLNNPSFKLTDSRYSAPDFEPHRYLLVEIVGDSLTITNTPIAVEEKKQTITRPM